MSDKRWEPNIDDLLPPFDGPHLDPPPPPCPFCQSCHVVLWEAMPPQVYACEDCGKYYSRAQAGRIEYQRKKARRE